METTIFHKKLPVDLRPLFWSYDFDAMDTEKNKRIIIINVINYGTWLQWKWLANIYGKEELRNIIQTIVTTELRPGAAKLLSLLLSLESAPHVLRGSYR